MLLLLTVNLLNNPVFSPGKCSICETGLYKKQQHKQQQQNNCSRSRQILGKSEVASVSVLPRSRRRCHVCRRRFHFCRLRKVHAPSHTQKPPFLPPSKLNSCPLPQIEAALVVTFAAVDQRTFLTSHAESLLCYSHCCCCYRRPTVKKGAKFIDMYRS